jgi:hypothetical protein
MKVERCSYFSASSNLRKQSYCIVSQSAVVHSGKDIRRVSVCPDSRSRKINRQKVAQPERAIFVFPRLPQVAVDPMERDEVDCERFIGWAFEREVVTGVWRGLNKLESANSSVQLGLVILQRISRIQNRPQTAGRIEGSEGALTFVVEDDED